jgi:2-haloacid dehalogenase
LTLIQDLKITGVYENFSAITRNSLLHALADNDSQLSDDNIEELMRAYDNLSTFADVDPTLTRIAADLSIQAVIFSNGTKTMVLNSILRSADLSPHASVFRDVVTVEEVKQYKPARACYEHLAKQTGQDPSHMSNLWLVSGNPFDIVGARSAGMRAIWVDRMGVGWKDGATDLRPTAIAHSLEHALQEIQSR